MTSRVAVRTPAGQVSDPATDKREKVRALPFRGSDADLVRGLVQRRPEAIVALYRRFAPELHALLFHLLGPSPDLEDVLHECFVRALASVDTLREPEALPGWMKGIAVNAARRHLQTRWRRRWLVLVPWHEVPETPQLGADVAARQLLRCVYGILERMPADERIALVLRLVEGLTVPEAAQTMGVSESTFKRCLTRARARLDRRARKHEALREWLSREEE